MSRFEHINLVINEKYSKNNYDNPNYFASLVILEMYKNAILMNVHYPFTWVAPLTMFLP
jgi:hypothetical protein